MLTDCIEAFTSTEQLGEGDEWFEFSIFPLVLTLSRYCSKCQSSQRAEKKFDLWRLPQVFGGASLNLRFTLRCLLFI